MVQRGKKAPLLTKRNNVEILDEGLDSGKRTLTSMQNLMCVRSMEKFEAELVYRC